jgi:hypothetical protein
MEIIAQVVNSKFNVVIEFSSSENQFYVSTYSRKRNNFIEMSIFDSDEDAVSHARNILAQ